MNKFKVKVQDYRQALLNYNDLIANNIEAEIRDLLVLFKKGCFFSKPSKIEEEYYTFQLRDINRKWSYDTDESEITYLRSKIKYNLKILDSLYLVQCDYFIADDTTLKFINEQFK